MIKEQELVYALEAKLASKLQKAQQLLGQIEDLRQEVEDLSIETSYLHAELSNSAMRIEIARKQKEIFEQAEKDGIVIPF